MIFESMNLLHLVDTREVFTFRITASSPSIAETVPSKWPTLSISSSIIFWCFSIISSDLLIWWFSCCWDVGAGGSGGVALMLVVQAFLGVFFKFFCDVEFNNVVELCNVVEFYDFPNSMKWFCCSRLRVQSELIGSWNECLNLLLRRWLKSSSLLVVWCIFYSLRIVILKNTSWSRSDELKELKLVDFPLVWSSLFTQVWLMERRYFSRSSA